MAVASLLHGTGAVHRRTSETHTTNDPSRPPLGSRARDAAGNEYVFVDFQQAVDEGEWVVINNSWQATPLNAMDAGFVGICVCAPSASDTEGWVQIYGRNDFALVTSDVTSASGLATVSNSTEGYLKPGFTSTPENNVYGAWTRSAASTATTSDVPATCSVELNYPFVLGFAHDLGILT